MAIIVLFHCDPWCLLTQNWLWVATNDISIRNFTTACHTTTHNTVAPYPFAPLHLVLPAPLGLPNDPQNIVLVCTVLPLVHHDEHNTIGESTIQPPAQQPLLT